MTPQAPLPAQREGRGGLLAAPPFRRAEKAAKASLESGAFQHPHYCLRAFDLSHRMTQIHTVVISVPCPSPGRGHSTSVDSSTIQAEVPSSQLQHGQRETSWWLRCLAMFMSKISGTKHLPQSSRFNGYNATLKGVQPALRSYRSVSTHYS